MIRYGALLFASFVVLTLFAALAFGGEAASADGVPSSELSVVMTIYFWGIPFGSVDLTSTIHGEQYSAVSNLRTTGIINLFWKQMIQAKSKGHIEGDRLRPAFYDALAILNDDSKEEVSLTYDGIDAPSIYVNPPFRDSVKILVPDAEQIDALDPVSAITFLMVDYRSGMEDPCDIVAPVFDGRRRYNIEFKKESDSDIDDSLYHGPALQCTVQYRQIAGPVQHVIPNNSDLPIAHAWFAKFPGKISGRNYYVPLRLSARTPYGTVTAEVTSLTVDGIMPKSSKN